MMNNLKKPKYRIGDTVKVKLSTRICNVKVEGERIGLIKSIDSVMHGQNIIYIYTIADNLTTTDNYSRHKEHEIFPSIKYSEHDKEMLLKFVDYVNINGGRAHKDDVLFFMKDIDNE